MDGILYVRPVEGWPRQKGIREIGRLRDALGEVGLKKALKYVFWALVMETYRFMIFPPLRVLFLKLMGAQIKGEVLVLDHIRFINVHRTGFKGLTMEPKSMIGHGAMLDLADEITIKEHASVSGTVLTHTNVGYHDHPLQKYLPAFSEPVVFERGCFVSMGTTVLPGVTIGECAVVSAGSLVARDVPPYCMVVGVPARIVKRLDREQEPAPEKGAAK
jgi:acetyltransferase-like isoleucine patch superfamily enzyme